MAVLTQSIVTVICDNPGCTRGNGMPTSLNWIQERVNEDPTALPEEANKIRTSAAFNGDRKVFCSFECEVEWAQSQINPEPPIGAAAFTNVKDFGSFKSRRIS